MSKWWWIVLAPALLAVAAVVAGQLGALRGREPADLGVRDGRLKPPSRTENSVSSQAGLHEGHPQQRGAAIAPLALNGDPAQTMARLRQAVEALPGARIVRSEPGYLYAQCETRLMRYVDDLELWYDPGAGVVQVRSASRIGRRDFDANRQRVEALRAALAAAR